MSRFDGFEEYVREAMSSWHCPGVAVAVVAGGAPAFDMTAGVRDYASGDAMSANTRFPMASITKAFTAMSIALLVEDGLLEWNKPVREYVPELTLNDAYVTEHLTVIDMLSHRSGLPRHDLAAWRLDLPRAEFVRRMRHLKFSTPFRERFIYNNLMYYIAPHLVERLAGVEWEEFVRERIFVPLGMTASSFSPDPPAGVENGGSKNALGYRADRDEEGEFTGLVHVPFGAHTTLSPGGAGALFSTLADMTRWLQLHVNEGALPDGSGRLISKENIKVMHTPHSIAPGGGVGEALHGTRISTYGLGWMIDPYAERTLLHHGGGVEGHTLHIGFVPDAGSGAGATNGGGAVAGAAGTGADSSGQPGAAGATNGGAAAGAAAAGTSGDVGVVVLSNLAFSPFPLVVMYEAIDRALGRVSRDWNAKYHAVVDPIQIATSRSRKTTAAEQIAGAPPSHELEAYIGTYAAEGYPEFAVRFAPQGREGAAADNTAGRENAAGPKNDGSENTGGPNSASPENAAGANTGGSPFQAGLVGSLGWSNLRHLHYDVFEWHIPDFDVRPKVKFLTDETGEVSSVSLPIEPEVDNVTFTRKAPELSDEQRAAVTGEYDPGIEGIVFSVSVAGETVFFAQSGSAPQKMSAYKAGDDEIGFRLEGSRIDFVLENGRAVRLVLKAPEMTLEAPRRGE